MPRSAPPTYEAVTVIVIQINSDWRIVSDPLQWIVQRRRTVKGKVKWDSRTFHSDLGNAVMRLASAQVRTFDARGRAGCIGGPLPLPGQP